MSILRVRFWIKRVRALMQGLWAQCTKSPIDSHEGQKKLLFLHDVCVENDKSLDFSYICVKKLRSTIYTEIFNLEKFI